MEEEMRRAYLTIVTAAALSLSSAAWAQQKIDQHRPAAADALVSIHNVAGSVTVAGWDRPEVAVGGTSRDVEAVEVTGGPERVVVEVKLRGVSNHGEAQLEVKVPKGGRVEIEAVSADVSVSGVAGGVRAESVSGTVKVVGPTPRVSAKSVSGNVNVENVGGVVKAGSVSGSVVIAGATTEDCDMETVSGDLRFGGTISPKGSLDAKTLSGSVSLDLPSGVAAEFALETFSGDLRTSFGEGRVETATFGPGKKARFTTGSGGARVSVKTFSGSITLSKR
jgi:DUF4097 and DUF4098 domain-containing protein YvlB